VGLGHRKTRRLSCQGVSPPQRLLDQRRNRRVSFNNATMLGPRRLVEGIPTTSREYRLASSTSFLSVEHECSFLLSEEMFQFPITTSWKDCHLRVAFKSLRAEALYAVPTRLSKCVAGLTWGLPLMDSCCERLPQFFRNAPLPKARTHFLVMCTTTDARCLFV